MMPKVSIYYLMVIYRLFLLIMGQKQSFFMITSTKNGIDMKCLDSQKPLCETTPSLSFVFIDREQSLMLFYVLLKFVASESTAQKSVGFKGTHKILDKQSIMILRFTLV